MGRFSMGYLSMALPPMPCLSLAWPPMGHLSMGYLSMASPPVPCPSLAWPPMGRLSMGWPSLASFPKASPAMAPLSLHLYAPQCPRRVSLSTVYARGHWGSPRPPGSPPRGGFRSPQRMCYGEQGRMGSAPDHVLCRALITTAPGKDLAASVSSGIAAYARQPR